jgi:hypothetical protein
MENKMNTKSILVVCGILLIALFIFFSLNKETSGEYNKSSLDIIPTSNANEILIEENNSILGLIDKSAGRAFSNGSGIARDIYFEVSRFNSADTAKVWKNEKEKEFDEWLNSYSKIIFSSPKVKMKQFNKDCKYWKAVRTINLLTFEKERYGIVLCQEKNFVLVTIVETESWFPIMDAKRYNKMLIKNLKESS